MQHFAVLVALFLILAEAGTSCTPTSSGGPAGGTGVATSTCPIPNPYKVDVGGGTSGEVSSVTVMAGATAIDDRTGTPWCNLTELALTKLDVAAAVSSPGIGCPADSSDKTLPCSPYGMLAVLDLRPTPVSFPTVGSRPELVYDLVSNPPQKECGSCQLVVYQLRDPLLSGMSNWRPVDKTATRSTVGGRAIAKANVDHFSVFALVELPPPEDPGAADAVFIVGSRFIDEGESMMMVQLAYVDGRLDTSRPLRQEMSLLYRFEHFDPGAIPSDAGCAGTPAEIMTCLFPIETVVHLQVLEQSVVLERVDDGVRVEFPAVVQVL